MKIINTGNFITLGISFLIAFGTVADPGQEATVSALTGHDVEEETAVKRADAVAIGKFEDLGQQSFSEPGEHYRQATVEIEQNLMGNAPTEVLCAYARHRTGSGGKEELPQLNVDYIIFLEFDQLHNYSIRKLLPKADGTVARIKALINALPQSQNGGNNTVK